MLINQKYEHGKPRSHVSLSCPYECWRKLGGLREEDSLFFTHQVKETGSSVAGRKNFGQDTDDNELNCVGWKSSNHAGTSLDPGMENHYMVPEQERVEHGEGPNKHHAMEAQIRNPQQRSAVGHPDVKVGG